jgi:ribosome-binding protein aMBF1 (putative translation factor)
LLQKIENSQMEPDDALITRLEKTLGIKLKGRIEYKMSGYVPMKATTLGDIAELK